MIPTTLLAALLPLLPFSLALTSAEMRPRSVYQVVTDRFALPDGSTTKACSSADRAYCGGTWAGLTSKLDYIKGMGFDTVWISPVVDNIPGSTGYGQAYHGYWTRNPDALNTNFGTDADLRALSAALHSKSMYLMLDVVVNHVASTSGASFAANSSYGPFDAQADFHPQCWVQNYNNQTEVEDCWLGDSTVALPDLNTESQSVIDYWNNWVKNMVANYSVDAIRIDTVKHVKHAFWPAFTAAAGVANVGEVLDPSPSYIGSYQKNATVNPFNYGVYYPLARAFNSTSGDLIALSNMINQVKGNSSDTSLYGSFINNHDNARFESWVTDKALIRNVQAWPFVGDGVPYVYYGSESGFNGANDPFNREAFWSTGYNTSTEMYAFFRRLNSVRRSAATASSTFYNNTMNVYVPSQNEIVILKQPLVAVLSNSGSSAANHTVPVESGASGWGPNTVLLDIVQCGTYTTDGSGNLQATISGGNPLVLIEKSKAGNVCDGFVALSTGSNTGTSGSGSGSGSGGKSAAGRVQIAWGVVGAGVIGAIGMMSVAL